MFPVRYAAEGRTFSLVEAGIVGTPTGKLLAINGMEDSIFPIEDTPIVATGGRQEGSDRARRPRPQG